MLTKSKSYCIIERTYLWPTEDFKEKDMKYRLICIDLDGTLLDSQRNVHPKTIEVLQKAHQKGAHIVISTGRLYSDAEHFSNIIGVDSPIIASNGGVIKGTGDRKSIYESTFEEALILKLYDIVAAYGQRLSVYTSDTMYFGSFKIFKTIFFERLWGKGIKNTKIRYIFSERHFNRIITREKDRIIKCELFDYNRDRIEKIRNELKQIDEIEITRSIYFCIEITKKGVSKGRAVELLAQHYNIEQTEIMAIGDSENDLTMIEFAHMGVAMGNASELLKSRADYITETNDQFGVAKAIEEMLLT